MFALLEQYSYHFGTIFAFPGGGRLFGTMFAFFGTIFVGTKGTFGTKFAAPNFLEGIVAAL